MTPNWHGNKSPHWKLEAPLNLFECIGWRDHTELIVYVKLSIVTNLKSYLINIGKEIPYLASMREILEGGTTCE